MIRQIRQRRQQARQVTDTENRRGNEARRVGGTHKGGRLEEKNYLSAIRLERILGQIRKKKKKIRREKKRIGRKKNKRLEKKMKGRINLASATRNAKCKST